VIAEEYEELEFLAEQLTLSNFERHRRRMRAAEQRLREAGIRFPLEHILEKMRRWEKEREGRRI
jgi:urease accessory protein UreE